MNTAAKDITQSIICTQDINTKIATLIRNSAILDLQFNIISISQNILDITGYNGVDLQGQSISILSATCDLKVQLEDHLRTGYFEDQLFDMRSKNGEKVSYCISGFYMGLIADINGLIVLKFKNEDEIHQITHELIAKTNELDEFIYASSHSLRGPLATLKGLINLAGATKDQTEIEFLIKQMTIFADRLDDKLHQLIFVAESDKNQQATFEDLSVQSIFQSLSHNIQEANIGFPVHFCCTVSDQQHTIEKGNLILTMLNNLVRFFCQQPKTKENILVFDMLSSSSATEIMFRSKGFTFNPSLLDKLTNVNFRYSEILNFPELTNYYAAKKIMYKMNGNIQFMLISSDEVVVLMTIPTFAHSHIPFPSAQLKTPVNR